jgi:hypothetical protein
MNITISIFDAEQIVRELTARTHTINSDIEALNQMVAPNAFVTVEGKGHLISIKENQLANLEELIDMIATKIDEAP